MESLNLPPFPSGFEQVGIGVIGSGSIIRQAHLPAYKLAGFRVAAIAARNDATREPLARDFNIPYQTSDWRDLMARDDVDVLDIGILGEGRIAITEAAAKAGKHLLVQKPLANTLDEARVMVGLAREGGILLAVNQNARWAPVYYAANAAIRQGLVGAPFDVVHLMRNSQGTADWWHASWGPSEPRYQIVQYSVHYIDVVRMFLDLPASCVSARTSHRSTRPARGEMAADVLITFPGEVTALISDRNNCRFDEPVRVTFSVEGTEGWLEGDVLAGTLTIGSARLEKPVTVTPPGNWFPNSFAYTMGDLLAAVATGSPLTVPGEDNLHTLEIIEAAYLSAAKGRSVALV